MVSFVSNLLNRKNKRKGHNEIEAIEPACFILKLVLLGDSLWRYDLQPWEICIVKWFLYQLRLMKMSAKWDEALPNGITFYPPPIQLGKSVNQYNLISSWEGFGCGHFCSSIESPEKMNILNLYYLYYENLFSKVGCFGKTRQNGLMGQKEFWKKNLDRNISKVF